MSQSPAQDKSSPLSKLRPIYHYREAPDSLKQKQNVSGVKQNENGPLAPRPSAGDQLHGKKSCPGSLRAISTPVLDLRAAQEGVGTGHSD